MRDAALDDGEGPEQHDPGGEARERRRRAPAVGLRVVEPVDEGEQPEGCGKGPGHVDPRLGGCGPGLQQRERGGSRGDREGEVHEQAPAPGQVLGERAAEQQAEGSAADGDAAEDPERPAALVRVAERGGQERQRGGGEQRGERALQRARSHEHAEALGRAAGRGGDGEADQADHQGRFAAAVVADPSSDQQQAAEGERVGGDDPLALAVGEVQRILRRRQRDVHDRRVEHDHQLRDGDEDEDPPAAGVHAIRAHGFHDERAPARRQPGPAPGSPSG